MRMLRNIEDADAAPCGCETQEVRCGCGSLLARVVDGAVELKCRRCKRVWRVHLESPEGAAELPRGRSSR